MVASDSRLEALAAEVRIGDDDGRLDVAATASQLGIPLRETDLGDYVEGVMLDGVIVLNRAHSSPGRKRFSFAHEVAHVLISRRQMPWGERRNEEWWADWFAQELIYPRRWLRDPGCWDQLSHFDDPAEFRTLALQLGALHVETKVVRVEDDVLCSWCGEREFFATCECRRYRHEGAWLDELPLFHAPSFLTVHQLQLFPSAEPYESLWRVLVRHGCDQTEQPSGRLTRQGGSAIFRDSRCRQGGMNGETLLGVA
jgi:hypothetical protein